MLNETQTTRVIQTEDTVSFKWVFSLRTFSANFTTYTPHFIPYKYIHIQCIKCKVFISTLYCERAIYVMPFSTGEHKICWELRGFRFGVSVKQMSTSAITKGGQTTRGREWMCREKVKAVKGEGNRVWTKHKGYYTDFSSITLCFLTVWHRIEILRLTSRFSQSYDYRKS